MGARDLDEEGRGVDEFKIVTLAEIHDTVAPLVAALLVRDGFAEVGRLKWVRSADAPVRQVFSFNQWKGGAVAPSWGISLDFVPHVSGSQLRWHRTPKSALLDLRVDSRDPSLDMSYYHGPAPIRERAPEVVPRAVAQACDFWGRSRRTEDLLSAFEWLQSYYAAHDGLGFYNFVQHPLALAFVYARARRVAEAQAELARYLQGAGLDSATEDKLRRRMNEQPNKGMKQ